MYGFGILCSNLNWNFRLSWVAFKYNHGRVASCGTEVDYVDGKEAKVVVSKEAHIKSCHHVPLSIEKKDNDLGTILKRTVNNNFSGLSFGLPFTKPNSEFVKSVNEKFSTDNKLLLVYQEGMRSAAAARKLEEEGFQNISCITSGLQSVKPTIRCRQGWPRIIQGKISAALGTILICNVLVFFPPCMHPQD
ncbi:hypothetical protein AMTRI_Chr03g138950 [Amborella trichopoda]